jgi:hypothetical protein
MKVHPRHFLVQQVKAELALEISKFIAKNEDKDLTVAEWLQIMNEVSFEKTARLVGTMIQDERNETEEGHSR